MSFIKRLFGKTNKVSLDDAEEFSSHFKNHLARIHQLGFPYSAFVNDYFPAEVVGVLTTAAAAKMALTQADNKEHSFSIFHPPVSYWICTLSTSVEGAKAWFVQGYGGYSKLLERAWSSNHFLGCEVLVHIIYSRSSKDPWVNMTIFPVKSKSFPFTPILPIDLLTEEEKRV